MISRQRRVRSIELSLTPREVVLVWLTNAMQAGTFIEGVRQSPPPRGGIANAVFRNVRDGMKGEPEPLVERAVLQARREADLLYLLVFKANMAVLENKEQRWREYVFLLAYLGAVMDGNITKDRVGILRLVIRTFLKSVVVLDAAIAQVAVEHLNGQPMLFRDCEAELKEQVRMAEGVSKIFNCLAPAVGSSKLSLEGLRKSLRSETDRQVASWIGCARAITFATFGSPEEMHAEIDRLLREPKPAVEMFNRMTYKELEAYVHHDTLPVWFTDTVA